MVIAYVLGLLTLPGLTLAGVGVIRLRGVLDAKGFSFEVKLCRKVDEIEDYTLRHDVWWERPFGPFFAGGWYHERLRYEAPSTAHFNRWVAIGSTHGPCFMAFRKRELGEVPDADE